MKHVQLIKKMESILFMKDGELVSVTNPAEKLLYSLSGNTRILVSEEVIEHWNVKSTKEADKRYWDWCEENKVDTRDYYLVITS